MTNGRSPFPLSTADNLRHMRRHVDQLHRIHHALRALGGGITSFTIAPPAIAREVDAMERTLGRPIPPALRQLFLDESAAFDIMWSIEGGKGRRAALDFAGSFDL